ncbi:sigma 54-interacting transcriptional regulator [Nannocystis sp.]|uniref:sigma 54-interacting transcriptional regulator n=1 Tax=Nannocystis sp. TaxID=1962667 RepID=UPI0025FBB64D|nr:sigma 54-interacting transcriptional regulator [Nannocystis sp.]
MLRERDLYHSLLELGTREELEPFVAEALALIVSVTGALRGYLELFEEHEDPSERGYWAVHGCSEDETPAFRAGISGSVISEALAKRITITSISALTDPRFRDSKSVKDNRIEAVLCAPVVAGKNLGVLYLQGRVPVDGRTPPGPFGEDARRHAETFARHIGAFTDRLLMRRRALRHDDPTQPYRRQLGAAEQVVGSSAAIARALRDAALAAPLDVGVLIVGATGTGKSMLARVIHQSGPRSGGPFVELNCAALPEGLLESELFGSLPGAHSTANRKVDGKVAAATGGTLFLDEIGELSLPAQAKLLQLLQDKEYFPLGSTRKVKADVRIIAATNGNLKAATANKTFREDLLYRLEVLTIRMPALDEREGDIPDLVHRACTRACEAHGFAALRCSPATVHAVQTASGRQRPPALSRDRDGDDPRPRRGGRADRAASPVPRPAAGG